MPPANSRMHGRIILRGGNRSSSVPIVGEHAATVSAAIANACDIASRLHPKAPCSGPRNRLKVNGTIAAKLTMTPTNAASVTLHPAYVGELSEAVFVGTGMLTLPVGLEPDGTSN